jgi:DNA-binding NarL/FixJ family response regulator
MSAVKKITVLLADDHAIVRQGLSALLNEEGDFLIVGQATNGREAVDLAKLLKPEVIVMDIAMPLLNGMEATRQILSVNSQARIVVLSAHSDDEYIERMTALGIAGFLEKQTSAEILGAAIREVVKGNIFYSPSIAKRLRNNQKPLRNRDGLVKVNGAELTTREAEVLQLVAEGSANKQVAATLGISVKTVEKHRQNLMDKLNIHDTAGLTRHAISAGVIESSVQLKIV